MIKQDVVFGVQTDRGVVVKVGISILAVPKISQKNKSSIKWFDDSKLIKKR